jgi:hypothetical protein
MAAVMQRRSRVDDEDLSDFDPAYFPRRVYKDGRGPRVRLELTDSAPSYRSRPALFDANAHRPHYAVVDASDPRVRAAAEARDAWIRDLQDAWKSGPVTSLTPSAAPPVSAASWADPPDNGDPDGDDDDLSPRDEYIKNLQTAYKWPPPPPPSANPSREADAIQAATARRQFPGTARPGAEGEAIAAARRGRRPTSGVTFGQHDPDNFPTADAALRDAAADRDAAHAEYVARIAGGWRR